MADAKQQGDVQPGDVQPGDDPGEATAEPIPVEKWIPHPVSDHGDLDRPAPAYADALAPNARAEYESALIERQAHLDAQAAEQEQKGKSGAKPPGKKPRPSRSERRAKKKPGGDGGVQA